LDRVVSSKWRTTARSRKPHVATDICSATGAGAGRRCGTEFRKRVPCRRPRVQQDRQDYRVADGRCEMMNVRRFSHFATSTLDQQPTKPSTKGHRGGHWCKTRKQKSLQTACVDQCPREAASVSKFTRSFRELRPEPGSGTQLNKSQGAQEFQFVRPKAWVPEQACETACEQSVEKKACHRRTSISAGIEAGEPTSRDIYQHPSWQKAGTRESGGTLALRSVS
jgi:hypothetical protein